VTGSRHRRKIYSSPTHFWFCGRPDWTLSALGTRACKSETQFVQTIPSYPSHLSLRAHNVKHGLGLSIHSGKEINDLD